MLRWHTISGEIRKSRLKSCWTKKGHHGNESTPAWSRTRPDHQYITDVLGQINLFKSLSISAKVPGWKPIFLPRLKTWQMWAKVTWNTENHSSNQPAIKKWKYFSFEPCHPFYIEYITQVTFLAFSKSPLFWKLLCTVLTAEMSYKLLKLQKNELL